MQNQTEKNFQPSRLETTAALSNGEAAPLQPFEREIPSEREGEYTTINERGDISVRCCRPDPDPTDPAHLATLNRIDPVGHKRNCGRTGPTTEIGQAVSAMNAVRHGCCAKTLILKTEDEADYLELQSRWASQYGASDEKTILYSLVVKVAQAEWFRIRAQREYDFLYAIQAGVEMCSWTPETHKKHDLQLRYLTTAERRFQREFKNLEDFWKRHHKPAIDAAAKAQAKTKADEPRLIAPRPLFVDNETGEAVDSQGNVYPAPPGYVAPKITPGVYDEDHPSNWLKTEKERLKRERK